MPKINFKDYLDNYDEIKTEEKNTKKVNDLKYQKEKAKEINQKYIELKEYLEILKNNLNTGSISKTEIEKNIRDNINNIQSLIRDTYDLCRKNRIYSNYVDTLKGTIGFFLVYLVVLIGAIVCEQLVIVPGTRLVFQIITILIWLITDILFSALTKEDVPTISSGFKALIGLLPFNNRYSFTKNFSKLKKLEKEYKMLEKQYDEYLKYLDSSEKSKVGESIIREKEVKDLYLLEITKLANKVKELPIDNERNNEREKYLIALEKLAELYKKEKESIILKNGRVHSEEEIELGINVLKQLAYIEMQINDKIYKNNNVNLLNEDYLTTLGKLDIAKDKKLKRTLSLRK